ncbi:putative RNA-binding, CRM domain-containing protein [Lupinus albus]|uniref:Putative RNA-binding, CRM domain-containing protein n=1 Tax=Lupinus albus TaxID=3870 RepID=A0A6A4PRN2_LUPAL|nr:putative RNA-binding, CRM domain-containing protein [Lupinus albus]
MLSSTRTNLHSHCFKSLSSLLHLHSNLYKNVVPLDHTSEHISSNAVQVQPCHKVTLYSSVKPFNFLNGSRRAMSTSKGRSMRSKVEKRMQKESGKTLREIRRASKLKKKLMTEEERLIYNLKRAKKKVALLLQKLKKYELPELPPPRHDPELFTPEQLQAYKKIGFRNKNYVPVGVRGVFGGVVQNMHLHWKFHETVQVCCDNFAKEKIKEMASMLARLSGGIVVNVHNVKTIIMFRGRNYRQPKNLIPINTLTKRKALFKARFEQALESQKLNIKKFEQQLRRMGVNPEDPAALASIQRVASTFFNAIDKKDGSPYVFHEGKQSITEPAEGSEESDLEPSLDSDQEELDQFIAEIEDAADKEYEAEEAKEQEELGRIRYRNKDEFGGRFRGSDAFRNNDDYDDDGRSSRARPTTHPKHRAIVSNDEDCDDHSDNDDGDEWQSGNIAYATDLDSGSDGSNEARGRFKGSRVERENRNNIGIGTGRVNKSSNRQGHHSEAKFKRNVGVENSESEGMFSDVDNAMWESDVEEIDSAHSKKVHDNYKSSSSSEDDDDGDENAYQIKRAKRNGGKVDGSAKHHNSFGAANNVRGRQERVSRSGSDSSESEDLFINSEKWMLHSDSRGENSSNVVKSDIDKRRTPKDADEAWDSD